MNSNENHKIFANPTTLSVQDFMRFEQNILQLAEYIGLDLNTLRIDHLALRANSLYQTQLWYDLLIKCGRILSRNQVNGRPIYLFELINPLMFAGQNVSVVELPCPKGKIYPQEGWEHIEVLMPFLPEESVSRWQNRIEHLYLLNQRRELRVKVSEPKVEGEQSANPSIAVSLISEQHNHCCIKIHPFDIKDIIEV